MIDEDSGMNPAAPQDGQIAPWLADVRNQVGGGPLDDAIVAIQQHVNQRNVADANRAEGDSFVTGMAAVKDGLLSVVQRDPTAADAAMQVARHVTAAALEHAGVPDDKAEQAHADLSGHLEQQIAHTAVQRMAEIDKPAAQAMLDKYGEHFSDTDHDAAGHYIDAMDAARGIDHDAAMAQARGQQAAASQASSFGHAQALLDPATESVRFPPNWMQSVVADTSVSSGDKTALFDTFKRLRTQGDAAQSDGFLVHDLLRNMGQAVDPATRDRALAEAGTGLRYADAQMLHGMALRNAPEDAAEVASLSATLRRVRDVTVGRDGTENGVAGANAFNRAVNWILPAYRRAGPGALNPEADNYLLANTTPASFAPAADDLPRGGNRSRSLSSIFGRRG